MSAMTLFIIVLILGMVCRRIGGKCSGIAGIVSVSGILMIAFGAYGIITALV